MSIKALFGTAVAALALATVPPSATTIQFSYTGTNLFGPLALGSANLTVTYADEFNSFGGHDVTGISGDVDGDAITGFAPTFDPSTNPPGGLDFGMTDAGQGFCVADQSVFDAGPRLSYYGLSLLSGANIYNFFSEDGGYSLLSVPKNARELPPEQYTDPTYLPEFLSYSHGIAAVPEPATWALLTLGFGLTGAAVRRRQRGPALASS